ncbi:DNA-invertase hin [Prochlorococcus marinus str. MIT 1318]|uniref:recombinase family protein n=1 Tax=Prochlorococcus TaxID=1218 RepID=UPI0007BAE6F4|nr:recombinase family protein [Prochlorococcus marinus]KZR71453.1 DNA-invertase hin [Prochlorococcus marinus str. MIT 1318]
MIDIQALRQRAPASTSCQTADHQAEALNEADCCLNYHQAISTSLKEVGRPQLQIALAAIDKGDELVVVKLNRIGRNQVEAIARLQDLQKKGIHIRTVDSLVNTRTIGKLMPVLLGFFLVLLK